MVCTFFGHKDAPKGVNSILESTLRELIEKEKVTFFYVGNNGDFDHMVKNQLKRMKILYPSIDYAIVLAYRPDDKSKMEKEEYSHTLYPEILATTPAQYAIIKRNQWMISKADYVITYVKRPFGGAAKFKTEAEQKGKIVLNLADYNRP